MTRAAATVLRPDTQVRHESQPNAGVGPQEIDSNDTHRGSVSQTRSGVVAVEPQPAAHNDDVSHVVAGGGLGLDHINLMRLRLYASLFASIQDARIDAFNRSGTRADGTPTKTTSATPAAAALDAPVIQSILAGMVESERTAGLAMRKEYRRCAPPAVRAWQQATPGMGEHLVSLLLGFVGHPAVAAPARWEGTGTGRRLVCESPRPRRLRQLYAYAGHGDASRRRAVKGATAEQLFAAGRPTVKSLVFLLASAAIKQPRRRWTPETGGAWKTDDTPDDIEDLGQDLPPIAVTHATGPPAAGPGLETPPPPPPPRAITNAIPTPVAGVGEQTCPPPTPGTHATPMTAADSTTPEVWRYRDTYERGRDLYQTRTHAEPCVRCGPAGKPAPIGSPWSKAHQHAAAIRLVGKQLLRDMWHAAQQEKATPCSAGKK